MGEIARSESIIGIELAEQSAVERATKLVFAYEPLLFLNKEEEVN